MKLPTFIKWTSPFSSPGLLGAVFHSYSNFNGTSTENLIKHCSLWRLILACTTSHKKNASLILVTYVCCICYLHQLYCCIHCSDFYRLLISFANSLDQDNDRFSRSWSRSKTRDILKNQQTTTKAWKITQHARGALKRTILQV